MENNLKLNEKEFIENLEKIHETYRVHEAENIGFINYNDDERIYSSLNFTIIFNIASIIIFILFSKIIYFIMSLNLGLNIETIFFLNLISPIFLIAISFLIIEKKTSFKNFILYKMIKKKIFLKRNKIIEHKLLYIKNNKKKEDFASNIIESKLLYESNANNLNPEKLCIEAINYVYKNDVVYSIDQLDYFIKPFLTKKALKEYEKRKLVIKNNLKNEKNKIELNIELKNI